MKTSNYDKFPVVDVPNHRCTTGWDGIGRVLRSRDARVIAVDTYPGMLDDEVLPALVKALSPSLVVHTNDAMWPAARIEELTAHEFWAADAVLGRMTQKALEAFFDPLLLERHRRTIESHRDGAVLVYGIGATLLCNPDLLIYADLARWEIQQRQRAKQVRAIGIDNRQRSTWEQYKRGFFIDWRVADQYKRSIWPQIDLFLDTNKPGNPKMVDAAAVNDGLNRAVKQPFRVVPFFDPGVWGGQWMKEVCDLDRSAVNYAWCFDCVPEENSLFLKFGDVTFELPSINVVFQHPRALLGDHVFNKFGAEFPIRFDFLDTMGGGNLSLQVHPLTHYIRDTFGMDYTQDESYYLLDAGTDACVYLGFKPNVNPNDFVKVLELAQADPTQPLDAERFINRFPAKKHDHFLIPAGTIHCSGSDSMVLEISATPYIFTHKLWDWGRVDLDGKPRPISIHHGKLNLDYSRDTDWTRRELVNRFELLAEGKGWREERTGLHATEFIETRRHWFTSAVEHDTRDTVNVLNLVEGREAIVESPDGAFAPFVVHYAETFIVPAAIGRYVIRPAEGAGACATMKAFVRS